MEIQCLCKERYGSLASGYGDCELYVNLKGELGNSTDCFGKTRCLVTSCGEFWICSDSIGRLWKFVEFQRGIQEL